MGTGHFLWKSQVTVNGKHLLYDGEAELRTPDLEVGTAPGAVAQARICLGLPLDTRGSTTLDPIFQARQALVKPDNRDG